MQLENRMSGKKWIQKLLTPADIAILYLYLLHSVNCSSANLVTSLMLHLNSHVTTVFYRFSETYFVSRTERWYGGSVPAVFAKLRDSNYKCDPYQPAAEQFDGQGSYGNGSGMRVMPVALFCYFDTAMLKQVE